MNNKNIKTQITCPVPKAGPMVSTSEGKTGRTLVRPVIKFFENLKQKTTDNKVNSQINFFEKKKHSSPNYENSVDPVPDEPRQDDKLMSVKEKINLFEK